MTNEKHKRAKKNNPSLREVEYKRNMANSKYILPFTYS